MIFEASEVIDSLFRTKKFEEKYDILKTIHSYVERSGFDVEVYFKGERLIIECFDTFTYSKMKGIASILKDIVAKHGFSFLVKFNGRRS
ncbi:MAG: hypothetical protein NZ870_00890 [bacterium]|nr:hypothetical protein [bacterium]